MALIKCKGCGHMVSDKAKVCPKCGYFVRLSIEQQQAETKEPQEVEPVQKVTKETVKTEHTQQNSWKTPLLIAIFIIVAVATAAYFVIRNDSNSSHGSNQDKVAIADTTTEVHKEEYGQDSPPSELAVATEETDSIAVDSSVADSWEEICLSGSMTDENGIFPIEISFERQGDELRNCIYKNVDLGGKIRMEGECVYNELVFTGKDGTYTFQIRIDAESLEGIATDGPKELYVSLDRKDM